MYVFCRHLNALISFYPSWWVGVHGIFLLKIDVLVLNLNLSKTVCLVYMTVQCILIIRLCNNIWLWIQPPINSEVPLSMAEIAPYHSHNLDVFNIKSSGPDCSHCFHSPLLQECFQKYGNITREQQIPKNGNKITPAN